MAFHRASENSFRTYMQQKNEKLYEQFEEQQQAAGGEKESIFKGVCIFVNGFTRPSHLELKQIMARYGGFFVNYINKDVTHIICANLPDSKLKLKERVKERDPKPVLLPEWITDSVRAGHRLPLEDYSLSRIRDKPGQKALTGFTPQKATRSVAELQAAPSMGLPKAAEMHELRLGGPDGCQHRPTLDLSLDSFDQRSRHQGHQGPHEGPAHRPPGSLAGLVGLAKKLQQAQDAAVPSPEKEAHQQHERSAKRQVLTMSAEGPDNPHIDKQNQEAGQRASPKQLKDSSAASLHAWHQMDVADKSSTPPLHVTESVEDSQTEPAEKLQEDLHRRHSCPETGPERSATQNELEQRDLFEPDLAETAAPPQEEHCISQERAYIEPKQYPKPNLKHAELHRHEPNIGWGTAGVEVREAATSAQPEQQQAMQCAHDSGTSEQCHTPAAAGMCGADRGGSVSAPGPPLPQAQPRPPDSSAVMGDSSATTEERPLARQPSRHLDINMPMERLAQDTSQQGAELYAMKARQRCDLLRGPPRSSRDDPAFQQTYFSASRLHFIGSWKARNEALLLGMVNEGPRPSAPPRGGSRTIVHIDMDCFFASVAALGVPALQGKPLCVSHSASKQGAGEVSSANYEARAFGVHAVMFIGEARRLCPNLIVMPYEFDKYEDISDKVYKLLMETSSSVQPISCDEAFMDITGLGNPDQVVRQLRDRIVAATGINASAGIGPNMLLARLATKRAKPNGQVNISPSQADEELLKLNVGDLPGVGWQMQKKLEKLGLPSVADIRNSRRELLQRELGAKSGSMVWEFAHGQDSRLVEAPQARKSIGAQVYYGVRLDGDADADKFLDDLAGHLSARLVEAGVKGRHLTLKIKRKKAGAPEPIKFLGHGPCDDYSRSVTLPRFIASPSDIAKEAKLLLKMLAIPPQELRGVGLAMAKLDSDPSSAAARTSAGAPSKGAAAPATVYNPRVDTLYESFFNLPTVKAAMPPEVPEQAAAQDPPKLPGRKPPGSRPASKHGDVLNMLSRSGKKASEDTGGSTASAPALSKPALASEPAAGSTRNTYTGPLISRAGKRGSTAAFSSTAMARAAAEDARQADSSALYPPQPSYRQASVMDLLNRPQSSSSGPAQDALHSPRYASRHIPGHTQNMVQPQAVHPPSCDAAWLEGRIAEGMPAIQGGLGDPLGLPLAGQSPDKSISPLTLLGDGACHNAEQCPGQQLANERTPSFAQLDSHNSFSAQQASPSAAAASRAAGTEAESSPGGDADLVNRIQTKADAGYSEVWPVQNGLCADEAAGCISEGDMAAAARDAQEGQQPHNPLAEIDASTWASLPAAVQARILAGEAVNLEAAARALEAAGPAPQRQHAEERASTTPIQALPPASALDLDVLDALPLHLKRELERAYGVGTMKSPPKRRRGGSNVVVGRPPKRQRPLTETFKSPIKARVAVGKMTMSQVDPAVFAELPAEVAAELAAALPPSHASFFSEGNIPPDPGSCLPGGTDTAAAAQHDARAKVAAKKLRQSRLGPDEDVRQVWRSLESVLEELDQQCWSEDESEVLAAEGHELKSAHATEDPVLESSSCLAGVTASDMEESGFPAPSSTMEDKPHPESGAQTVAPPQGHRPEAENILPCSGQGGSPGQKRAPVLVRLGAVCEVVLQWGRSLVASNLESLQFLLLRLRTAARQHNMFAGHLEAVTASLEADVLQRYGSRITLKTALYR